MVTKNRRPLELKLGKLGLIVFVSGMSLLLVVMFLLGVQVGKHLEAYPERYSGGLVALVRDRLSGVVLAPQQEKAPPADGQKPDSDNLSGNEAFDLTFYKVLGEKNNNNRSVEGEATSNSPKSDKTSVSGATAKKDSKLGGAPAVTAPEKDAPGKPAPVNHASSNEAAKPVLPEPKEFSAEPALPESSSLPGSSGADNKGRMGGFQVQAAAYRDIRQAEKIENMLKYLGFTARIVSIEIPGKGIWFRVIAGDFENRQKAEIAASRIDGKIKGVKCIIRPNNGNGA